MKRTLLAGLAAVPVLLVGCQNTASDDSSAPMSTDQVEDAIPASQQVTLKMTGMT